MRRIRECPREVWVVKLADRITNLDEPPHYWTAEKRRGYQAEARRIHAALAEAHAVLGARLAARIEAYAKFFPKDPPVRSVAATRDSWSSDHRGHCVV